MITLKELHKKTNELKVKFKCGDKVKVIKPGRGLASVYLGKIVTIVGIKLQGYGGAKEHGYIIEPKIGNCANMEDPRKIKYGYDCIGQSSFELVERK